MQKVQFRFKSIFKEHCLFNTDEVEKDGENVPENDEAKADLKVPPLKIVLSSQTMADTEPSNNRLIRNTNQKTNQNLPYIVNTSLNENAVEKDDVTALVNQIPEKLDDKKDKVSVSLYGRPKHICANYQGCVKVICN